MYTRSLTLLLAAPLLGGCTDTLGLGGGCQAEMATVRRQFGSPDDTRDGAGGRSQIWVYDAEGGRSRFTYEFDWSEGVCIVSGPNSFLVDPLDSPAAR